MTGPIRPKGAGPIQVPDASAPVADTNAPSFRETLASNRAVSASPLKDAGLADLAARVRDGSVTRTEAIDSLVMRALESAAPLNDAGRTALEAHLRSTIESDPTLQKLFEKIRA